MLTYWLIPFPQQRINFKTSIQDPNFARENLQPFVWWREEEDEEEEEGATVEDTH